MTSIALHRRKFSRSERKRVRKMKYKNSLPYNCYSITLRNISRQLYVYFTENVTLLDTRHWCRNMWCEYLSVFPNTDLLVVLLQ